MRERLGEVKEIQALGSTPRGPGFSSFTRLRFERGSQLIEHLWSPQGELMGMRAGGSLPQREFLPVGPAEFARFNLRALRAVYLRLTSGTAEFVESKTRARRVDGAAIAP